MSLRMYHSLLCACSTHPQFSARSQPIYSIISFEAGMLVVGGCGGFCSTIIPSSTPPSRMNDG